ncbi:MAG TPA: response regulator [Burkholderiales bacterium]|nr:response regulator [Burkholderiales bacterium]
MANELVLIVEDDASSRKLARDLLAVNGYRTIECETGEEGLRLALELYPALILMDIQLPGISGIEALKRLREDARTKNIPAIAVTASVTMRERSEIKEAGFDGFQSKPISIAGFLGAVREALAPRGSG